jgi:hypothetical protein
MALLIRRGLESARTSITPLAGEIIYTTDDKLVYIGDGSTPGGVLVGGNGYSLRTATAAGTDAYTATIPGVTAYTTHQVFEIIFTNANTGSSTININSLGAKTLKKSVSTNLASGDINAGQSFFIVYDGTNFQVIGLGGGGSGTPGGSDTQVQFNDGGSFGGDAGMTYNKTTNVLTVGDVEVTDEAYGAGWNGSLEVPTKNAVYDKIETIGGGTPGGSDTQVQFNDGGSFGGEAAFVYNKTTNTLTVDNIILNAETASRIVATDASKQLDTPYTFRDEDNMTSNDATGIPSQQSVKSYVDSKIVTGNDIFLNLNFY